MEEATATRQKHASNWSTEAQTPTTLLMRIPVAGLCNFLQASDKKERLIWAAVLIIAAGITLYYFIPCVMAFVEFQTVVEVRHVNNPTIPFPSVYIGLPDALNSTYISQLWLKVIDQLAMDSRVKQFTRWFARRNKTVSVSDLIDRASAYSTFSPVLEPWFDKDEPAIYNELIYRTIAAYGSNWPGLSDGYEHVAYPCDMLLDMCKFNNVPFSCCEKSETFMISSNIWHKPNVSAAASNAKGNVPINEVPTLVIHTRFLAETILSAEFFTRWTGVAVSFGGTAPSMFDGIQIISGGTKAFMKIKGKRRQLMNGCIGRFKHDMNIRRQQPPDMQRYWDEMMENGNYTPNKCLFALLLEQIYPYCGCVPYYDTMKPNDTSICTPAHIYTCYTLGFQGGLSLDDGSGSSPTKEIFKRLKATATNTHRCQPLCDTWYYDAEITFASLDESSETDIRNELVITVDPEYRLESDVLKINLVSFYATLGDGLALFLGISAVTFVQLAVWGTAAWLLARKRRRVAPGAASAMSVAVSVMKRSIHGVVPSGWMERDQ